MAGAIEQEEAAPAEVQDTEATRFHPADDTCCATVLESCSSSYPDNGSLGPATQISDDTCNSNGCAVRSCTVCSPCSGISSCATAAVVTTAVAEPTALHSHPGLPALEKVTAGRSEQQQGKAAHAEELGTCSAADSSCTTAPVSCSSSCPEHGSPRPATQTSEVTCSSSITTPRENTTSTHPAADSSRDTAAASCSSSTPHHASPRPHPQESNVTCSSRTCTAVNATPCSTTDSISSCAAAVVCTAAATEPAAVYSQPGLPVLEHAMAGTIEQQQDSAANVQDLEDTSTGPAEATYCATALGSCSSSSSCPDHGSAGPATRISDVACTSKGSTARSSTSCGTVTWISSSTAAAVAEIRALHSYPDMPTLEKVMAGCCQRQQGTVDHVQDVDGTRSNPAAELGSRAAASSCCPTALVSCNSSSPKHGSPRPATQPSDAACSSSISIPREDITSTHPAADSSGDTAPVSCSSSCPDDATPRPATRNGDVTCNSGIGTPGVDTTSTHPAADSSRDTAPASCSSSTPDAASPRHGTQNRDVTCSSNGSTTGGGPSCTTVSSINSISATAAGVPMVAEPAASASSYPTLDLKRYRVFGDLVCSTCGDTGHVAEECSTCYCSMCCCYGHPTYGCLDACSNCGKIHAEPWGARCNVCRCMLCHLWGHLAATCPSARCNRCGLHGHMITECQEVLWCAPASSSSSSAPDLAAAAPTSICPRDSSAVASSSSSGSDLAAAAPAAVIISPQDLVPSQVRLQRPTDASEAMRWCQRLLQTLQAAVPAYAAAVGSQPHKLACLSHVAPDDLAAIMQREYPGHFLDQLYSHYCNATWGSSSSGSDLAAAAPAAVSTNPRDLSPSQIRLQRPIKASQARHWRRQLLQSLQAAVPAYAAAVGSQPHKLACLSHVAPDDLAEIMQLDHPADFLDRVYNHYSDSTQWWHQGAGSMLRSNSTVVDQRQQAAATTAGPAPFPAQPPRGTPLSRYQPAQGKATARPALAHCTGTVPVTTGSSYAPSSVPAAPFNYHPAADGNTALPRPDAAPVPVRMGSYYTPVAVPMFPAAPAPVPVYQMMVPEASCATPFTEYQAFAPHLAPPFATQFATQLAPHFAPQLVPQFAPQFAPPLVPQPCLPWPQELMHPAAAPAVPVWPVPQATAAAWQQQQSRQGLTMCNSRTSSSSSMQSSFKQTGMQPAAASAAAAAASRRELLTTVSSSSSPSVRRGLRGSSAGLCLRVQCILCGYFGHIADDCKACSICKQHGHTTGDCTEFPAADEEEVYAATAAVASVVASWQQPRTAAAATCLLPAAATAVTTAGSVIASRQPPRTAAAATAPARPPPAATAAAAVASVVASWQSPPPAAAAAACPPPAAAVAVPLPLLSPAQAPLPQTAAAAATAVAAAPLTTGAQQAVSNPAVAAMAKPAAEAARAAATVPPPPSQVVTHRTRNCLEHVNASTECGQPRYEGHERLGQLAKPAGTSCKNASMQPTRANAAAAAAGYVRAAKAAEAAATIALLQLPLPVAAAPRPPPAAATRALSPVLSSLALAPPPQAAATTAASLTACAAESPPPPPPQRHWADQKRGDAGRWTVPPPPPPQLLPPQLRPLPPQLPPPPRAPASAAATTATPPTLNASHPPLMPVAAAATDYLTPPPAPVQCAVQAAASSLGDEYQLQPEPATPEGLENMIAGLIQRLFVAAKSAYALDLLQQQHHGKLHCLARLSAADLDNILVRNESLELLDAVYEKHSQQQRYSKQSGDQELLPEQDCDRVHVQQQQRPASDPWQQPLMESSRKRAVQKGDVPTTSHSTVFSRGQKLDVLDSWQPPQQQQTDLSQLQGSTLQQGQVPQPEFASGSSERPESVMADDSRYFKSSSDSESEDLDLLLVMPTVAVPAHLQQATGQVELASESALVDQCTTPAEVAARSHNNPGDGGLAAIHEADVDSDGSDIADMLTMLMCR